MQSISPNHDSIALGIYFLVFVEHLPLKRSQVSEIADAHLPAVLDLLWALFQFYVIPSIAQKSGKAPAVRLRSYHLSIFWLSLCGCHPRAVSTADQKRLPQGERQGSDGLSAQTQSTPHQERHQSHAGRHSFGCCGGAVPSRPLG